MPDFFSIPDTLQPFFIPAALLLLLGLVYTFLSWKKTKAQREFFAEMHQKLKVGSKIMFSGGIFGTLTRVGNERCEVRVKDGSVFEISRFAIQEILDK